MVRRYYIDIFDEHGVVIHSCSRVLASKAMAEMAANAIMIGAKGASYKVR